MAGPAPTGSARARLVLSLVILAAAGAVLLGLDRRGRASRVFADQQAVLEVERAEQVYDVWRDAGVRGRTLLLFGPFPHAWRSTDLGAHQRGPDSFVTAAALDNVVRRIYVLVPDDDWEDLFGAPRPGFYRRVPGLARGLYMEYPLGLPVVATTPSSLPANAEPSLVYVDRRRFDPGAVQQYLARTGHPFDLLVVSTGL